MAMSDPIGDMLTRMRNALRAGHACVDMPASRMKVEICAVLKREGFIKDYAVTEVENSVRRQVRVTLKYAPDRKPVIQGLRRISKPSLRVYSRSAELRPIRSGMGISILSTSKGLMTGKQARASQLGGEILCEVW
jgi:small subunit ribosomal protein S8